MQDVVNIELTKLTEKVLDTSANRLTVGPGISFFQFEDDLYAAGKLIREYSKASSSGVRHFTDFIFTQPLETSTA